MKARKQAARTPPYRQSERSAIYREYIQRLIENGHAYYAFDTEAELEAHRENAKSSGHKTFQYDQVTRKSLKNSLSLTPSEVSELIASGASYVIRVCIPENETVVVQEQGHVVARPHDHRTTIGIDRACIFSSCP